MFGRRPIDSSQAVGRAALSTGRLTHIPITVHTDSPKTPTIEVESRASSSSLLGQVDPGRGGAAIPPAGLTARRLSPTGDDAPLPAPSAVLPVALHPVRLAGEEGTAQLRKREIVAVAGQGRARCRGEIQEGGVELAVAVPAAVIRRAEIGPHRARSKFGRKWRGVRGVLRLNSEAFSVRGDVLRKLSGGWPSESVITAAHQRITHQWWQARRAAFDLYVSELVLLEARAGDPDAASRRLAALAGIPVLEPTTAAEALTEQILRAKAHRPIATGRRV